LDGSGFAHLHLHTQYSILDGAIGIPPLVEHCARLGMPAVAITDHGNLFGAVEFHQHCRQAGLKPIIGCEVYVAQGSRFERDASTGGFNGINHMILLAMDEVGYANLVRLVSKAYLEGFYYKPRVDLELLRAHHEGLIATSGCLSGAIPSALQAGQRQRAWELVETYSRLFHDRFYLELQRHGIPAQEVVNRELLGMHRDLGLPLIATNDCHYLGCNDAQAHEALLCVQTGKTLHDHDRFRFDGQGFYVKGAAEMLELFHDVPHAVTRTVEIAERCRFVLPTGTSYLPEFDVPAGHTPASHLREVSHAGLRRRLGLEPDEPYAREHRDYQERLDYELRVITEKGYPGYFLIVWDFTRVAKERGIPVGPGRGSAAGSLVAYALGIVEIDPVRYRIPFERFLNPERPSMPDIDVDFCMNRRAEVIRYVEEKYNRGAGEDQRRVAGIVTFGTMAARAAVRDAGRVLGLSFAEVDRVAKLIPETLGITLPDALEGSRELRELVDKDPAVRQVMDLARSLEGQIRNPGRHAAGVVISSRPITEIAPLYRDPRSKEVVIQFDYRYCEEVGLIKFDLLGLRTLTIIADAVERVRRAHDPEFDIARTDLADPLTYELLSRGDTDGVFQVGQSQGMTELVLRIQPGEFRDLIPLVALYRPGPLQSGMVEDFVERRHGRRPVRYMLPELESLLAETYGVILYQDQVLQIANLIAGYTLGEGDLLRRAMGKKIPEVMEQQRAKFVEGAVARGHPREVVGQLFDLILQFAGYGFGKAHSAAYALLTHQTAYLKTHFPAEFFAATMTAEWREHDKLDRYMKDAARRGIRMRAPCVNASGAEFGVAEGGRAISFGLAGIKNVGEGAVEAILEARGAGGSFKSLADFCARVDLRRVNRRVIESLIRAGAFDFAGPSRAALWKGLGAALERAQRAARDRELGQGSLFGEAGPAAEPVLPDDPEWSHAERLAGEKEMLGFYVSGHPLLEHADLLRRFATLRLDALGAEAQSPRREVWVGGLVGGLRSTKTRRGELMARAQLEDLGGSLAVVFFPKVFDRLAPLLRADEPLLLRGTLIQDEERVELHVEDGVRLEDAWSRCTARLSFSLDATAASDALLCELRSILDLTPGEVPVRVELRLPGAQAVLELPRHRVQVSRELVERVEKLIGAEVATCTVT
jgi:DNA polymerase-3 subunit alpha